MSQPAASADAPLAPATVADLLAALVPASESWDQDDIARARRDCERDSGAR